MRMGWAEKFMIIFTALSKIDADSKLDWDWQSKLEAFVEKLKLAEAKKTEEVMDRYKLIPFANAFT